MYIIYDFSFQWFLEAASEEVAEEPAQVLGEGAVEEVTEEKTGEEEWRRRKGKHKS